MGVGVDGYTPDGIGMPPLFFLSLNSTSHLHRPSPVRNEAAILPFCGVWVNSTIPLHSAENRDLSCQRVPEKFTPIGRLSSSAAVGPAPTAVGSGSVTLKALLRPIQTDSREKQPARLMKNSLLTWLLKLSVRVLIGLAVTLLLLEIALQLGALLIKENAWRAKTHWLTGNIRVLTLGDSNTYGLYLPAEDSYPSQLEKSWNAQHPELPIEIINLGYPGTNSFRLRANLPEILNTFQPDLVLVMIGFNDFWTPAETPATAESLSLLQKLKFHSRVYKLLFMVFCRQAVDGKIDSGDRALGGFAGIHFSADEIRFLEQQMGMPLTDIQAQAQQANADPALI